MGWHRWIETIARHEEREAAEAEATAGDYDHLPRTVMKYLDME